jgi:hypothetical protein
MHLVVAEPGAHKKLVIKNKREGGADQNTAPREAPSEAERRSHASNRDTHKRLPQKEKENRQEGIEASFS